jgi:ribosomal protein S18 acetylase RimI-like enzyme
MAGFLFSAIVEENLLTVPIVGEGIMDQSYKIAPLGVTRNGDKEAVRKLMEELHRRGMPEVSHENLRDYAEGSYVLVARRKEDSRIVAMGRLVTYAGLWGREAQLGDIVTDPNHRGKGIASEICLQLIEEAKRINLKFLTLTSRDERQDAHRIYEKLGFKNVGQTNRFYLDLSHASAG